MTPQEGIEMSDEARKEEIATEQVALTEYLNGYVYAGDGGDYEPNEFELALIQDALHGWVAERDRMMADIRAESR